jgi:hypothetical protein
MEEVRGSNPLFSTTYQPLFQVPNCGSMLDLDQLQDELQVFEVMIAGYVGSVLRAAKLIPDDKWNWSCSEGTPTAREICEHTFAWLYCDRQQMTVADRSQHGPTPDPPSERASMIRLLEEEAAEWRKLIRSLTPDQMLVDHETWDGEMRNVRSFLFHMGQNVIYKAGQIWMLCFELGLDGVEPYAAPYPNHIYKFANAAPWPATRMVERDPVWSLLNRLDDPPRLWLLPARISPLTRAVQSVRTMSYLPRPFRLRIGLMALATCLMSTAAASTERAADYPRVVHAGPAFDAGPGIHSMDGFAYWLFEVTGPKGKWRVVAINGRPAEGIEACCGGVSPLSGRAPGTFRAPIHHFDGRVGDLRVEVEFVPDARLVDAQGVVTPARTPVRIFFDKFDPVTWWEVAWWSWSPEQVKNPRYAMPSLSELATGPPLQTWGFDKLDLVRPGAPIKGVPADHFLTRAETHIEVAPGHYEVELTADDGVRLWVDHRLVIDRWHAQPATTYKAYLRLGGKHRLRVEHYEIDDVAVLKLDIRRLRRLD